MCKVIELNPEPDHKVCRFCGCIIDEEEKGNWFWEEEICSSYCEDRHTYPEWYVED